MEDWPTILPIWLKGYSSSYMNAVRRTVIPGKTAQRRVSQRNAEIVSASLRLFGAELALFEYFVQEVLSEGQDFFNGSYLDNGAVESGKMRIVGGKYNVSAISTRNWRVTCQLEVIRDHA